ncbi:MAG: HAD family hydrolase [Hyphomicrobiales bacterium]
MHGLVIFDCDGVLIDSEALSCEVLIEELAREGIPVDREYVFKECIGHSFPAVAQKIGASFGRVIPQGFEARYRETLLRRFDGALQPTPGVRHVLENLAAPYCIATSSGKERAECSLAGAGLADPKVPLFTASMVAHGKPAPDLFLFAAAQMGVSPSSCLVLEDSLAGIAAARAAGMEVWRYRGGGHFDLGFGRDDHDLAHGHLSRWADFFSAFPHLHRRP